MKAKNRLSLAALSAALLACSAEPAGEAAVDPAPALPATPAPSHDFAIATDAGIYFLDRDATHLRTTINYTYTNRTGELVSLLNCNGAYGVRLEKLDAGDWATAWIPGMNACLSEPIQLAPGESLEDRVEIVGGESGSEVFPHFQTEMTGTFRLVIDSAILDYQPNGPWEKKPPMEERVSNPFEIRVRG